MTSFFPGFLGDDARTLETVGPRTSSPAPPPETPPDPPPRFFNHGQAFRVRVRLFVRSLSWDRRQEIARRPRFRNQPYLRRAGDFDPDDQLP